MSDRWGRKSTIFVSLLTGGLLIGSIPLFPSGWLLLPVVSLGGMALFAVGPIIQASGLEHAPEGYLGRGTDIHGRGAGPRSPWSSR